MNNILIDDQCIIVNHVRNTLYNYVVLNVKRKPFKKNHHGFHHRIHMDHIEEN